MQISTFNIDSEKNHLNLERFSQHLDIIQYKITENKFENLFTMVEWVEQNDEDAALIINSNFKPENYDYDEILHSAIDLVREGIFIFALDNRPDLKKISSVANYLSVVESWENVAGWIIFKPVFNAIKHLINVHFLRNDTTATLDNFFSTLSPTKFTFNSCIRNHEIEHKIHVIVPFRNATEYIEECILSIQKQKYQNYRVIFIDDCSFDDSASKIPKNPKFKAIINKERKFALKNIVDILLLEEFDDNDIICLLDGDDKLAHPHAFNILNGVYLSNPFLISYGSFRRYNSLDTFGAEYTANEFTEIRKAAWKASHLKTFKYNLFRTYLNSDPLLKYLRDKNGEFITMPYDMALMFPLLEIAGKNRSKFINTPLYIYRTHGDNDHTVNQQQQAEGESLIRSMIDITINPENNIIS